MKTQSILKIYEYFKKNISDWRLQGKVVHDIHAYFTLALISMLKGHNTYIDMYNFITYTLIKDKSLIKALNIDIKNMPKYNTFCTFFQESNNVEMESCFREMMKPYIHNNMNIAIDGKSLNGSDINGQYTTIKHTQILNILNKDLKVTIAHRLLLNKKSEILATISILDEPFCELGHQIFTFDALHTQVETLNKIHNNHNYYVARVKNNQLSLKNTIKEYIKSNTHSNIYESGYVQENHNQVKRITKIYNSNSTNLVLFDAKFPHIHTIIEQHKIIVNSITGKTTTQVCLFIANWKATAIKFHDTILCHWNIETYHYHLDDYFQEDQHKAYKNCFTISIIRQLCLNFMQLYINNNPEMKMKDIKRECTYRNVDFIGTLLNNIIK